jgi:hypothetical protein
MNYILKLNNIYFIGTKNKGKFIAKNSDLEWCKKWVLLLNENPLKESYLTVRKYYGL